MCSVCFVVTTTPSLFLAKPGNRLLSDSRRHMISGRHGHADAGGNAMQHEDTSPRGLPLHAGEPALETSLYGPRRGFTGSLRADEELLRTDFGLKPLRFQGFAVGAQRSRRVALVCLEEAAGAAPLGILADRIGRLATVRVEGAGHLARLLDGDSWSPFPRSQATERPDRAVAALAEGKAVILLEGSPTALIAPAGLFSFMREPDDANQNRLVGAGLFVLRLLALAGAVFLPALYVAATTYDYFLTPVRLFADLAAARLHTPLSPMLEMLLVLVIVEALWEGAVRLATPLGLLAGGVGGVLAGAVAAVLGFVSPYALLTGTVTLITGLILPVRDLGPTARLLRLGFLAVTAIFGLLGMVVAASLTFAHLVSLESFGQPYVGPLPPLSRNGPPRMAAWGPGKTRPGRGRGMADRNTFTARQMALFLVSAQVGLGMIVLPSTLAQKLGHDGWLAVLLTGALSTAVALPLGLLVRRHGGKSIYEINRALFGRIAGTVLNVALLVYLNFLTIMAIRLFTEFIQLYQLGFTPAIAAAVLVIAPTYYVVSQGLQPLSRFSVFLLVVLAAIVALSFLVHGDIRTSFLRPVGAAGWRPSSAACRTSRSPISGWSCRSLLTPGSGTRNGLCGGSSLPICFPPSSSWSS